MKEEMKKNKIIIIILAIILIMGILVGLIVYLKNNEKKKIIEGLSNISSLIDKNDYTAASEKLNELSKSTQENEDIKQQVNNLTNKIKEEEIEKFKNEQEVTVEDTRIVVSNSEYKSLYPDAIEVVIKNNTEKTIKDYELSILGYDNNNLPVKIKTQYSFGRSSYEFIGKSEASNIMPGKTYGRDYGWSLDENHGISKIIAIVKNVKYYDDTTWENPYYEYWLSEHKEKPLQ